MTFTPVPFLWFARLTRPKAAASPPFDLLAGQSLDLRLAPGDALHVVAGEVLLLRAPRWLGDMLVQPAALRLREGAGWTSVEHERVTLTGSRRSRVVRIAR